MNHIWVTETLNGPQKRTNMVLIGMFFQPYSQNPVRAGASDGAVHPLYIFQMYSCWYISPATFREANLLLIHSAALEPNMHVANLFGLLQFVKRRCQPLRQTKQHAGFCGLYDFLWKLI